jgi:hypothetical protein
MKMFSKISRYYKLPEVVTIDASGRFIESKSIRQLPLVSGTFEHTIEAIDRLDHLAFKYYKQPRKWWRICDANPAFLSPLALLGQEPVVTDLFPLTLLDELNPPPWATLRRVLTSLAGVLDLQILEEAELVEEAQMVGTEEVVVWVEVFQRAALVTYNEMNVSIAALMAALETAGFMVGEPVRNGRVGKPIIVPPDSVR